MQLSFSKIIFFLTLLCSVAFAGGIEEDSSPDEISETTTSEQVDSTANLTTREDINEYISIISAISLFENISNSNNNSNFD